MNINRKTLRCVQLLVALYLIGLLGKLLIPARMVTEQNLSTRLEGPGWPHVLGTDQYGRDLFARLLVGLELDLRIVFLTVLLASLGVFVGVLVGLAPAWIDRTVMRVVDSFLSIPTLVVVLIVVGIVGPGLFNSMLGVALSMSLIYIRIARSETLNQKQEHYLLAARQSGIKRSRLVMFHLLPSVSRPVIIETATLFRAVLLVEATLSYFGLGVQDPAPSLGRLLYNAQVVALEAPYQALPPGLILVAIVFLLNFGSDGLSEQLAPQRTSDPAKRAARVSAKKEAQSTANDSKNLALNMRGLTLELAVSSQVTAKLVRNVKLEVAPGEIVAVVGESGSGKTLTAMSVDGFIPSGSELICDGILVNGQDITQLDARAMRQLRTKYLSVVFQDPIAHMNPSWTIGEHLTRPMRVLHGISKEEAEQKAIGLLEEVGISGAQERMGQYPHQLSGGIAQRVMIASALIGDPELLIADEPTSALDVTIQVRILELLGQLCADRGLSILLITHDMGVVSKMAHRTYVMYAGEVVESAIRDESGLNLKHPYTKALLAAVPRNVERTGPLASLPGAVPRPLKEFPGCRFADRCPSVMDECEKNPISLVTEGLGEVRCLLYDSKPSDGLTTQVTP